MAKEAADDFGPFATNCEKLFARRFMRLLLDYLLCLFGRCGDIACPCSFHKENILHSLAKTHHFATFSLERSKCCLHHVHCPRSRDLQCRGFPLTQAQRGETEFHVAIINLRGYQPKNLRDGRSNRPGDEERWLYNLNSRRRRKVGKGSCVIASHSPTISSLFRGGGVESSI